MVDNERKSRPTSYSGTSSSASEISQFVHIFQDYQKPAKTSKEKEDNSRDTTKAWESDSERSRISSQYLRTCGRSLHSVADYS